MENTCGAASWLQPPCSSIFAATAIKAACSRVQPLFDRAEGEATRELALGEPAEDHDRGHRGERRGREFGPEESLWIGERCDGDRKRAGVHRRHVDAPERFVP